MQSYILLGRLCCFVYMLVVYMDVKITLSVYSVVSLAICHSIGIASLSGLTGRTILLTCK